MADESVDTEVLVVGAGPTGLMLACWLVREGIDVVVVDRKDGPTRESRAIVLQARSVEVYDQLGLGDRVLAQSENPRAVSPGFESRSFGTVALGQLGRDLTPFPGLHVLEQSRNERILLDHLAALGGDVRWRHGLVALERAPGESDGVEALVETPHDGRVRVRARYCLGADGGGSTVRTLSGIPFEGATNPLTFYVVDAAAVEGLTSGAVNVRPAADDFLLAFPMGPGEHHRLIGTVRGGPGSPELAEAAVRERLARIFEVRWGKTAWFSTYQVHHRIAASFRDGPVLLAGDAAHVHSPVGAQGMNTGLQDAHNLALTLVDVLRRGAPDAVLDRYEAERRPVARRLVRTTDRLFGAVTSQAAWARLGRRVVPRVVAPLATRVLPRTPGGARVFGYLSQTRIHYWMDERARVGGRRGRVVGRRLPWTGQNFDVLRTATWQVHGYGADVGPAVRAMLESSLGTPVHVFPECLAKGLDPALLYLVRPDGFVAAAAPVGTAAELLAEALPVHRPGR